MKIVLCTPLYPPDIAEPAPYIKDLATRLSKSHEVTIVTYGRLPEKIPGVSIVAVDKRQPVIPRLRAYWSALRHSVKEDAQVVYAENGASVELPASFISSHLIFHIGDEKAHGRTKQNPLRYLLEKLVCLRARAGLKGSPLHRPEIIPFEKLPVLAAYEASWQSHMTQVNDALSHAK